MSLLSYHTTGSEFFQKLFIIAYPIFVSLTGFVDKLPLRIKKKSSR